MTQLLVLQWNSISEEEEEYKKYIVRRNWPKYLQINKFKLFYYKYNKYNKYIKVGYAKRRLSIYLIRSYGKTVHTKELKF